MHSGSADGGHYYSFNKERNPQSSNYGKWFEFDDTRVKPFDMQHHKKEWFGGQQQKKDEFEEETPAQKAMYERCCNAYLIVYERVGSAQQVSPPQTQLFS